MTNGGTFWAFAAIAALVRIALRGIWRNPIMAAVSFSVSVGLAYVFTPIAVHYMGLTDAPTDIAAGVGGGIAILGAEVIERLYHASITFKRGGLEITSRDRSKR